MLFRRVDLVGGQSLGIEISILNYEVRFHDGFSQIWKIKSIVRMELYQSHLNILLRNFLIKYFRPVSTGCVQKEKLFGYVCQDFFKN